MKLYILMTGSLDGVNGVVLYVRNKIKYMQQMGWDVVLMHSHDTKKKIYVEDLKRWNKPQYTFPFLDNYPACYGKKKLENIITQVIGKLPNTNLVEKSVIETLNYKRACWGELLAKHLHARHIFLSTTENPYILNNEYFKFLRFKFERNELKGIQESSMMRLFEGWMHLNPSPSHTVPAYCQNCIDDIESPFEEAYRIDEDYHICTIGRMDKKYVLPMIEGIREFCKETHKTVQLFIFGGAYSNEARQKVENVLREFKYLNSVVTDFIFPVPISLLEKMDLAIATAGAAIGLNEVGLPTISMDSQDGEPIGLMGVTTNAAIYRTDEEKITLSEWLKKVLIDKASQRNIQKIDYSANLSQEMVKHGQWLEDVNSPLIYFDTSKIFNEGSPRTSHRFRAYRLLGKNKVDIVLKRILRRGE